MRVSRSEPSTNLDDRIYTDDPNQSDSVTVDSNESDLVTRVDAETVTRVNKKRQRCEHENEEEDLCDVSLDMIDEIEKLRHVKTLLQRFRTTMTRNLRLTVGDNKTLTSAVDSIQDAATSLDKHIVFITATMINKDDYHYSYRPKFAE